MARDGSDGLFAVERMHEFTQAFHDKLPHAGFRLTSPGYFAAMGVPLVTGRDFDERDLYDAEPVAIVSAALARQVFRGESPIGGRIMCGLDREVWMRVVGVVGDMRNETPASRRPPSCTWPIVSIPITPTTCTSSCARRPRWRLRRAG